MGQDTLQIIAIVGYGNLFLNETRDVAPELLGANSAFKYVGEVTFSRHVNKTDQIGILVAMGTAEWYSLLWKENASRLSYIAFRWDRSDLAEHVAVGFSNGVPMAIQTDFPDHFELWYPLWTNTQDVGWKVRYRGLRFERSSALPPRRLQEVKTELKEAISQTEAFARRPEVGQIDWADWFSKALQQIDSQSPQGAFYPNVLPDVGYSLASRQILAACQQADVFGGMGSWNDIGFEDKRLQNEYNQLSAQLYSAIKIGYVTVANLFGLNAD